MADLLHSSAAETLLEGKAPTAEEVNTLIGQLRYLHRCTPDDLTDQTRDLGLLPLAGGHHNRVYRWDRLGGPVCVKLYKVDERDRAGTEWRALTHMVDHHAPGVPAPLWFAPDSAQPAAVMTMVPGRSLLTAEQPETAVLAMAPVLHALRSIPLGPFARKPRNGTAQRYINRLVDTWGPELKEHDHDPMARDLLRLLQHWLDGDDQETLARPATAVFSHGDGNLGNWHLEHNTDTAHVVDFEFAGYSDPAFDAADLIEHISSHPIPDDAWNALLPSFGIDDAITQHRFRAAQRTCALRWLRSMWKQKATRTEEFHHQLDRVRRLTHKLETAHN